MSRLKKLTVTSAARFVLQGLLLLTLILVGIDLLFQDENFRKSYAWAVEWVPLGRMDSIPLLILGGLCLFLPLAYLFLRWVECRLERGIVGKGSEGEDICLAPEAVERAIIREIREQVPEVLRVRSCTALQGKKGPRIIIRVATSDRASVPTIQKSTREVTRHVLTRLIGFADGSDIRVKVQDLVGASRGRAPKKIRKKPSSKGVDSPKPKRMEDTP
ncbi:MAG: hypothetical protein JJU11_15575 [Candidatus Sumerlaeia bacterium]|nr:hypothetical protein [Candidatus Sumerlaeia bacterium]